MISRTSSTAISLVAFLGFSPALCAQRVKIPTLEEILQRLETNLNHYDSSVPSLFCDEHVISRIEPSSHNPDTVTDSIFRLKRIFNADHTTTLVELREIKTVNGKPATSQKMDGSSLLSGAFEGGLAVELHVAADQWETPDRALHCSFRHRSYPSEFRQLSSAGGEQRPRLHRSCIHAGHASGAYYSTPHHHSGKRI